MTCTLLRRPCRAALFAALLSSACTRGADDAPFSPSDFVRFERTAKGQGRLETARVTYRNADGVEVTLEAAVHIADQAYYQALQKEFADYDALLYELVAAEGTVPQKGQVGGGLIGLFQRGLKNVLDLEFQLDGIDYTRENFVHADLDPETFARLQSERGESLVGLILKASLEAWRLQAGGEGPSFGPAHILVALASEDSARVLKYFLAQELEDIEKVFSGIEDGEGGSVLVGERNKAALRVLEKEIEGGKKRLGIFYGAAHMPDIEERLVRELGFRKVRERWITAWDVRKQVAPEERHSAKDS